MQIQEIPLDDIASSPFNPRIFGPKDTKDPALVSLSESIRAKGVLEPVLVRPISTAAPIGFEIIAGERRLRASRLAERETIPAIVREGLTDQEALELTVTENLQREDLRPLEEANGVASLLKSGLDVAAVADRLGGKSPAWVARRARLAQLSPAWRKLAEDPKSPVSDWPATTLEQVARLEPAAQEAFLAEYRWIVNDPHRLVDQLADFTRELRLAPWKLDDDALLPVAGACTSCPKRSSCTPGLFDDDLDGKRAKAGDRCLDSTCWDRKLDLHLAQKADELETEHGKVAFAGYLSHGEKLPAFVTKRGARLVETWNSTKSKAGAAGAVPVLHVAGRERGKLEFLVFGRESKSAKASRARGEKPKPASLADRKKKLEGRRQAHALVATCVAVEKAKAPTIQDVVLLACAFGTEGNADRMDGGYSGGGFERPVGHLRKSSIEATARLWRLVASVLTTRWQNALRWQGLKGIETIRPEIADVTKRLGLDLSPLAAAAEKAIPEPRSWAKESAPAKKSTKKKASGGTR